MTVFPVLPDLQESMPAARNKTARHQAAIQFSTAHASLLPDEQQTYSY